MPAEREIVRYMHDVEACRALAASLAARDGLACTDDARDFLDKVAGWDADWELSRRQAEFLLGIRDDNRYVTTLYDFDLAAVFWECWAARADLEEEGDAAFLERLKAQGAKQYRVADARRLLRLARTLPGVVD